MRKRDKDKKETASTAATGTTTIEADSVEEAMQRIASEHGSAAEIVEARKVNRGGIGGFFAKERVQLTVKAPQIEATTPEDSDGLAGVLDRMTRNAEAHEAEFATMLRNELGDDNTSDLGLDTFLEAVGWDAKKSAAAAEETLQAAGDVAAATTQAPVQAPAEMQPATAATSLQPTADVAPRPAMTQTVAGNATAELAARAMARAAMQQAPTPPPIVVQHPGLETPAPPAPTPLEKVVDAGAATPEVLRQAAREGVITANPTQVAAAAGTTRDRTEPAELPSWRITPLDADPAGMGAVAWSTMEMVRCGIPTEIVSAVAELNPTDDLAWITGLAEAVAPYCESPQGVDTVLVGDHALELATALDIDIVDPGQTAPYAGSFASAITTDQHDRDWLQFVRGKRQLHYVIGSDRTWRDTMIDAPAVVSWTDEAALVDALYLAVAFDARLGFGATPKADARFAKVYPIDVALAIRAMMGRS